MVSFNTSESATEFNDVNVISCFTGWLPEPLPLRFGHIGEVWKFLKETLPKYQWAEEKAKAQLEEELLAQMLLENELKEEANANDGKEAKSDAKDKKKVKEAAKNAGGGGKETKMDKHKKDVLKEKKGGKTLTDEAFVDESYVPDFAEMVVLASFSDLPLNKLSASSEMADRREKLRKYNLNHDFSSPVWITCTRDVTLNPPPPPEKVPVWKTIRQRKKLIVPSDEPISKQQVID